MQQETYVKFLNLVDTFKDVPSLEAVKATNAGDSPGVGASKAKDHIILFRGCLARAVRTQQGNGLAGWNVEVDAPNCLDRAVGLGQADGPDPGGRGEICGHLTIIVGWVSAVEELDPTAESGVSCLSSHRSSGTALKALAGSVPPNALTGMGHRPSAIGPPV